MDSTYSTVNTGGKKKSSTAIFVIAIICFAAALFARFNPQYSYYSNMYDYYMIYADKYSDEYLAKKATAREYNYGTFFYNSYMDIARQYWELYDEAMNNADECKIKTNIMTGGAIALGCAGIVLIIVGSIKRKK